MLSVSHRRPLLLLLIAIALMFSATFAAAAETRAAGSEIVCRYYVVRKGDTLRAISARFGVSTKTLQDVNDIRNRNVIFAGQRLCIPTAPPTPTPAPDPWTDPDIAIEVYSPVQSIIYHSPIEVIGNSLTFEGMVNIRLRDAGGEVIAERYAMGGGVEYDFFHTYIRFDTMDLQDATLEVFEISAMDGAEINKVEIPIRIAPGQRTVDLLSPKVGEVICGSINVSGYSDTFEANVVIAAWPRDIEAINEAPTMGGSIGFYKEFGEMIEPFSPEIGFEPGAPLAMFVSAYESGAADGSIDWTVVPITSYADADHPACRP